MSNREILETNTSKKGESVIHLVRRTIPVLILFLTHQLTSFHCQLHHHISNEAKAFSVLKGPAAPKTMAGRAQGAQAARPTIQSKALKSYQNPQRKPDRLPPVPPCFRGDLLNFRGVFTAIASIVSCVLPCFAYDENVYEKHKVPILERGLHTEKQDSEAAFCNHEELRG